MHVMEMIKPFVWRATSEKSVKCNKKKTHPKTLLTLLDNVCDKTLSTRKKKKREEILNKKHNYNLNGICYFFGNISFWKCMDHHNWKRKIDKGKFIFFFTAVEFQTDHFELFKLSKKKQTMLLVFLVINFFLISPWRVYFHQH